MCLPLALIGSSAHPPDLIGFGTEFRSRSSSNESANALIDVALFGFSAFGSRGEAPSSAAAAAARRPFLADFEHRQNY